MKQLTKEQAIEFGQSRAWESMDFRQRAEFQMMQEKLCMPFGAFHEAIEKILGRPVYTHEFALNREGLRKELFEGKEPPTFEEILLMIPEAKRIVVTT